MRWGYRDCALSQCLSTDVGWLAPRRHGCRRQRRLVSRYTEGLYDESFVDRKRCLLNNAKSGPKSAVLDGGLQCHTAPQQRMADWTFGFKFLEAVR